MTTRRPPGALLVALAMSTLPSCTDEWAEDQKPSDEDPYFTRAEWRTIESLAIDLDAFGPPADRSNAYAESDAAAALGHKLFFDCHLGRPGIEGIGQQPAVHTGRSCATCHQPELGFSDNGLLDMGKDITSVLNITYYDYHTSSGKFDSLWSMPMAPTENGFLQTDRLAVAKLIARDYREDYIAVFAQSWQEHGEIALFDRVDEVANFDRWSCPKEQPTCEDALSKANSPPLEELKGYINRIYANYGKALDAYMRRITPGPSAFDNYVAWKLELLDPEAGESLDLGPAAKHGLELFLNDAGCIGCHNGEYFTDNAFHNIGLASADGSGRWEALDLWRTSDPTSPRTPVEFSRTSIYSDDDSIELEFPEPTEADNGAFRTPGLRDVARTGPYLHTAEMSDLEEVLWHYEEPGSSPNLDPFFKYWAPALGTAEEHDLIAFLETLSGDDAMIDERWTKDPDGVDSSCRCEAIGGCGAAIRSR